MAQDMRMACKKIAPLWPLENFVAVNPYLGLIDQPFDVAAQQLATVAGIQMTLPISFYKDKIRERKITKKDLQLAFAKSEMIDVDIDAFISELGRLEDGEQSVATIATATDVATQATKQDWNRFVVSRLSSWAAAYFDNGQAQWCSASTGVGLFEAWKAEASVDMTPEISGLRGFKKTVKALPNHPLKAAQQAIKLLDLPKEGVSVFLHRLLLRVGGWSAFVARIDWDNALYGKKGDAMMEWLAVLICWEACLLQCLDSPELRFLWLTAKKRLSEAGADTDIGEELRSKLILQEAFDIATQRELIGNFEAGVTKQPKEVSTPIAQAVFCIDVRSEVFRRNLEQVDEQIETMGFAGFFAFPINFIPIAHNKGEAQCPVLIPTGPTILEKIPDDREHEKAETGRVLSHKVRDIWKSFRSGAVTCFSFVSPIGLSYLPKLFTDSYGLTRPVAHPEHAGLRQSKSGKKSVSLNVAVHGEVPVGISLEQRVKMAKNALTAMSVTDNFAPFFLLVGHGATTVNNPHATGLDCGACGGHSGEANAKVAAAVLNDKDVRKSLANEKIVIPEETVFLACLHDTTTDEIRIFNEEVVPDTHTAKLSTLKKSLAKASKAARAERALRMCVGRNIDASIIGRSKDWSQVRPEWGLAGCSAFVVAPRGRTQHLNLGGKAFLHSYEWKKDSGFSVLELIMTAPMVVTSWINLQYYGSTVDNTHFGSGNKTLHNVTAGVGVLEGYSGDLRVGLPMQSVHDGEKYQHEPARLNVVIEAPIEAMNSILEKHPSVRSLCDNGWINLLCMDENGLVTFRYTKDLHWEKI
nr:DUF2309 family protein [Cytophagales bacterium]